MLLLLLACTELPIETTDTVAPDAVALVRTANGLALKRGETLLWSLDGVERVAFTEDVESGLGIWQFTRTSEETFPFSTVFPAGSGSYEFLDASGARATLATTTTETATHFALEVAEPLDGIALTLPCTETSTFHGFGEQYHRSDQRGEAFNLFVSEQGIGRDGSLFTFTGDRHTTYFPMPYYLDVSTGIGVLLETDYRVNVDLCSSDPAVARLEATEGTSLSWTVFHGPTPLAVIEQLTDHIGRPSRPPDWAFGTWMVTQGGREVVREEVDAILEAEIPATALWLQDWTGRRQNPGGGYGVQYRWEPDEEELYPDISGFVDELHSDGFKVLGYVNPFADQALQHWPDLVAGGMLPLDEDGNPYTFLGPRGEMSTVDLSNPATRAYIYERLKTAVTETGLDGWMADFAEWLPLDARIHEGDARGFHNRYPEAWQSITREVMEEVRPDGDWVMFARSGWTGVHSVAQIHWVGDQEADFEATDGLPTVVPAMLTLSLSGQPFVTHDVAGFSGGPSTPELFARWTELGAFSPILRTHDGNNRDNNHRWNTDPETTEHFVAFSNIHAALLPELLEAADQAAETSSPIVRHLLLDFGDDPETWSIDDQFLLGSGLLVAPVTEEGVTKREVYLPAGDWFDVWTGTKHVGPARIEHPAPIGRPPVFHRGEDRADLRAWLP